MSNIKSETIPGRRLITHNMMTSAALFETRQVMSWQNIQDLSAFIDLFCLYDRVAIIGRKGSSKQLSTWESDFFGLLKDTHFVDIQEPDDLKIEAVIKSASKHLAVFFEEKEIDKFNNLFTKILESENYDLRREPVSENSPRFTIEELFEDPSRTHILKQLNHRGRTFLIRTFLYLGYADVSQLSFTPDSFRSPIIKTILNQEEQFRGKLLSTIQETWEEKIPGDKRMLSRVSPFAAIVFKNSGKNRKNILIEMQKLRADVAGFRQRLRGIEDNLSGYKSASDAIEAQEQWNKIINEIAASLGESHPLKVTLKFALNLAEPVGGVLDKPQSWASWSKLAELPIHLYERITARRKAIEVHNLIDTRHLPGTAKLRSDIKEIFGEIK